MKNRIDRNGELMKRDNSCSIKKIDLLEKINSKEMQKSSIKEKVLTTLMLSWFVGTTVMMIIAGLFEKASSISLMTFGQFFFVLGLIAIYDDIKKKNIPSFVIIFVLVGFVSMLLGVFLFFADEKISSILENCGSSIFVFGLLAIIVILVILEVNKKIHLNNHCTMRVLAKVVENDNEIEDECIVFKIENPRKTGEFIELVSTSDICNYKVGDKAYLLINPDKPSEFMVDTKDYNKKSIIIMLTLAIVVMLMVLIYVLIL